MPTAACVDGASFVYARQPGALPVTSSTSDGDSLGGDSSGYGAGRAARGGFTSRGPRGWLRRLRGGEEAASLPGSVSQELELSAMAPSEHLNSGAISPAESGDEYAMAPMPAGSHLRY